MSAMSVPSNTWLQPTAVDSVASLPAPTVPSLRSAAAEPRRLGGTAGTFGASANLDCFAAKGDQVAVLEFLFSSTNRVSSRTQPST